MGKGRGGRTCSKVLAGIDAPEQTAATTSEIEIKMSISRLKRQYVTI